VPSIEGCRLPLNFGLLPLPAGPILLTRWFGVTVSNGDRNLGDEQACIVEIVGTILLAQKQAAAKGRCPLHRGTRGAIGFMCRINMQLFGQPHASPHLPHGHRADADTC